MSDLESLVKTLEKNPRDTISIQAIADWIEERGGEPESVRLLTLNNGDILFIGYRPGSPDEFVQRLLDIGQVLHQHLARHGIDVATVTVPSDVTLRVVKNIACTGVMNKP